MERLKESITAVSWRTLSIEYLSLLCGVKCQLWLAQKEFHSTSLSLLFVSEQSWKALPEDFHACRRAVGRLFGCKVKNFIGNSKLFRSIFLIMNHHVAFFLSFMPNRALEIFTLQFKLFCSSISVVLRFNYSCFTTQFQLFCSSITIIFDWQNYLISNLESGCTFCHN